MTRDPRVVSPQDTVQQAARLMKDFDVGVVPVCNVQRLQALGSCMPRTGCRACRLRARLHSNAPLGNGIC